MTRRKMQLRSLVSHRSLVSASLDGGFSITRNDRWARLVAFVVLAVVMSVSSTAHSETDEPFVLDHQKAHAFSNGEMSQLDYFERCAETQYECAMFAGTVLRKLRRFEDADRFYKLALVNGEKRAATSLAILHTDQKNRIEAFAWSHLAYVLADPRRELSESETAKLLSFRYLATNYRAMTAKQRDEAEVRATELVDIWIPRIYNQPQKLDDEPKALGETLEIVDQPHPRYPRGLLAERAEGFATIYALVGLDGKVIYAAPLDYTHRLFANQAVKAIEKWQFRITDPERVYPVSITQTFEFRLDDLASR